MRSRILAIALLLGVAAAAAAQDTSPLKAGQTYERALAKSETHAYTLDLAKDRFVFGLANQQSVDVVVTVTGPDGALVANFDGPARGPEPFQFTSGAAGRYRIEVKSFQGAEGRYTLTLARIEKKATTPEGVVAQLMAGYDGPGTPGGVVAVVQHGRLRFAKAYGLASLEQGVRNTVERPFNIGSVAKQFTGFGIALLAERGELSLDDDIRTYLPEVPDFGDTIRIRHLISHTSGLREFLNLLAMSGRDVLGGDVIRHDEVLGIVERQPALQSAPGAKHLYNNTGYVLLAEIIERVTKRPFAEWMAENVFQPVGMQHTVVVTAPGQIVPRRAEGHTFASDGGFKRAPDVGGSWGAGGIYSTAADLAQWLENFGSSRVGGPRVMERMTTRGVLTTGDTLSYALGLFVDEHRGLKRIQHGGNDAGHAAQIAYYPELNAGVIVLSNLAGSHAAELADRVAEAFFAAQMAPAKQPTQAAAIDTGAELSVSPAQLDRYTGEYRMEGGPVVRFTREGEVLYTQLGKQPRLTLRPLSDSTFQVIAPNVDARVSFHATGQGTVEGATIHQSGRSFALKRREPWRPTAEELATYTGRFFSPELQTFYTIALRDGALVAKHARIGEVALTPAEDETFRSGNLALQQLVFERDAARGVTGFALSNGRTLGIRFERQP